jgi:hypothetical protein
LLLILFPILASLLVLAQIVNPDPALQMSGLAVGVGPDILAPGAPDWLDPTIGILTQPFGALSAQDWLHGIVPWWNPFTGVGMPLAAEMQSLSFFLPFVLLLKFSHGWIFLKISLQICSGLAMYALLIGLGLRRLAAFVPAVCFALNGTFFMDPHAVGPLPFLPLLLLGVEQAGRRRAWVLIPFSVAYSIYAGYPEVAYLDGMLAAAWALFRFSTLRQARWLFAGKIFIGVALGLCMALPLIVPFLQYLGLSFLGPHGGAYAGLAINSNIAPVVVFPFIFGPLGILKNGMIFDWWNLGGWFGLPVCMLAVAAVLRPGNFRGLAWLLAGFVVLWLLRAWGFYPAVFIADKIPFVARTNVIRFIWPALEAAMFILAAFGLENWLAAGRLGRRDILLLPVVLAGIILVAILPDWARLYAWYSSGPPAGWEYGFIMVIVSLAIAISLVCLLSLSPVRRRQFAVAALVVMDAFITAFMPQFSTPRSGQLDQSAIAFLQQNQGLARFYTLQPFGPDYPSAEGVASINYNALPVAQSWTDYIHHHLDPYADEILFNGSLPRPATLDPAGLPDQMTEFEKNISGYETVGVKYLLTQPDQEPFANLVSLPVSNSTGQAVPVTAEQPVGGTVPSSVITETTVSAIGVLIATYAGAASGELDFQLCAKSDCVNGGTNLAGVPDNRFVKIQLDHNFVIPAGTLMHYTFSHNAGGPVALWLANVKAGAPATLKLDNGSPTPWIRFYGQPTSNSMKLVFQNQIMNIYSLPNYRPYYTSLPACSFSNEDWNHVVAHCPRAATLTRLEESFPGWHVRVNGKTSVPAQVNEIFQGVSLPAGTSQVDFYYIPNGTRISVSIALLAASIWLGLIILGYRPPCQRGIDR